MRRTAAHLGRDRGEVPRVLWAFSAWLVGCLLPACAEPMATLELRAEPSSIDGRGRTASIVAIATDPRGRTGQGLVSFSSSEGQLSQSEAELDAYGTARVTYSCLSVTEPSCSGAVEVKAAWQSASGTITEQVHIGVVPPAVVVTPCVKAANKALRYAGTEYVVTPDSPSLHLSDFTVEAWVNFSGVTPANYNTIVAKPLATATKDSFTVWYQFGGLYAGVNPTKPADAIGKTWAPTFGHWYHVAFSFDHATLAERLYLDGALFASGKAASAPTYDDHPFFIGGDTDNEMASGFFVGTIDEVRIWTSVRSPTGIQADLRECTPGAFDGLAAYFAFDEGAGQRVDDLSGNGNTVRLGSTADVDAADPTWIDSTVPY